MNESLSIIFSRARVRTRRVMEHFYRAHAIEVLEIMIQSLDTDFQVGTVHSSMAFFLTPVYRDPYWADPPHLSLLTPSLTTHKQLYICYVMA